VEEPACKPDLVPALAGRGDHLSEPITGPRQRPRTAGAARAAYPGASDGPPSNAPCLALLRVGLAEPDRSPDPLVSSYLTVSPLPLAGRSVLCCAVREVTPAWALPSTLPCGVRTFLERANAPAAARPAPP
jgi:hypothetical protein